MVVVVVVVIWIGETDISTDTPMALVLFGFHLFLFSPFHEQKMRHVLLGPIPNDEACLNHFWSQASCLGCLKRNRFGSSVAAIFASFSERI